MKHVTTDACRSYGCRECREEEPDLETLEVWMNDGRAEATDGCPVEPDGTCPHGKQSWLLVMRLI